MPHEKYIPTYQFGNTRVSEADDDYVFGNITSFPLLLFLYRFQAIYHLTIIMWVI